MKVVIFGLSISSSWGNGHATLWRGLCWALAACGHRVVFFEWDRPYYAAHRDLYELPRGSQLHLYKDWLDTKELAERELSDADVGLVTSYCADGIAATELVLASAALKVFYDLDTPVTLQTLEQGNELNYLGPRGLRDFDLVLSYTGGDALEKLRARLGARRVAALYGSVDPHRHRPAPAEARFTADLSYLGTYAGDRQAALEELFIEPARLRSAARFLIGGAQYPAEFPWTANVYFVQHLEPAQHPAFFSSSRLTLNVTRGPMKAMGYCPSGRLFEAAACGAPLLSDAWVGLEAFFAPGEEVLVAGSRDDTLAAMAESDANLVRMARAARERVLSEHTALHRVRQLERLLEATWSAHPVSVGAIQTEV